MDGDFAKSFSLFLRHQYYYCKPLINENTSTQKLLVIT